MKKIKSVPVKREVVREVVTESADQVVDEEGGMITLLGKKVCLMGLNYIYSGKLVGVNATCVALEEAGIVYLTGEWNLPAWKDFQKLPTKTVFVQTEAIESFFEVNK